MVKRHKEKCTLCPAGKRSMTPYTLTKHIEHVHNKQKTKKHRNNDRHKKRWCRICKKFISRRTTNHFGVHRTLGEMPDTPAHILPRPEPEKDHPPSEETVTDSAYDVASDMGASAFIEEQKEGAIPTDEDHVPQRTPQFGNVIEITKQMKTLKF